MIKFFGKIRQQLITEKQFSKYILYAIGEIALVVMGILLALQINEWSHERKERVLEKTYYCKLSEDIKQDDNQIKQQLIDSEIRIKFSNEMIHLLQQE